VSEISDKEVRIEWRSIDASVKAFNSMVTGGKPEEATFLVKHAPAGMFLYFDDRGIIGNPNVLEMLLARKALDYAAWVKLNLEEIKAK
jgi:hypothetical protein